MHSLPFVAPLAPVALAALVATVVSGVRPAPSAALSTQATQTTERAGAAGHTARTARATLGPAALRFGRSLGSPTDGHLVGGMRVEESAALRIVPADTAGDVRWGLEPLVTMLDRAARQVRHQYPQVVLSVGHLSREGGGDIDQSRSHESGRDADVGFYVRAASGKQLLESHFVPFRADGTAASWPGAYFDDAKNWALVAAFLTDPDARVTHVFVAAPLRARLLAYAEKNGVSPALRLRAAEILQQPRGTLPHDDHFHVRIGCPAHMSECIENPAVRVHVTEPALAHGRRGPITHGPHDFEPVAAAPSHKTSHPPDLPESGAGTNPGPRPAWSSGGKPGWNPAAKPDWKPESKPGQRDAPPLDPDDVPASPPASFAVPLDDVDG